MPVAAAAAAAVAFAVAGALRGRGRPSPAAGVRVVTSLTARELELLREVPGGDEQRLGVLVGEMGKRLVGRPLDNDATALRLLEAIVEQQQQQQRELSPASQQ